MGCITPKVKIQVFKGGHYITCQQYEAISETTANHVYNVTVPSVETIICREVQWQSTVALRISNPNKAATDFAIKYGVTDALAPFSATQLNQRHVMHYQQQYHESGRARIATAPSAYGGPRSPKTTP
ncbi:MAG: phage major capsid domain-containing protein [Candidatus Fonsibacter sp.]